MKDERARKQASVTSSNKKSTVAFTEDDAMSLLENAEDILDVETDRSDEAWAAWAKVVGLSILGTLFYKVWRS